MRVFNRQELLLVTGLAAALLIIFSAQVTRLLDYIREIERQTGLSLLPALVVLVLVYTFYQLRQRHEVQAQAAAAQAATQEAERRAEELERLVAFGQALGRSLDFDSIRAAVVQHLPRVTGTDDYWVLIRQGSEWEALGGETRSADDGLQWRDLAERVLASKGMDRPGEGHVEGFPLMVGGAALGVLGVRSAAGPLTADRRRIVEAAAALLAVTVKNAQLFRELRESSVRDPLTGCFLRAYALEVVDAELRRARRSQTPVSLIMFDLDRFKEVNDRYGHLCGDAVLSTVGRRMRDVLRGSDLKCRYGGEEFLVLLPETPLHGARRVAETLRREIADRPIPWGGDALTITASFGLAQTTPGEVNVQALIARADQALYRAKEDGRNCVRIAADAGALVSRDERTGR